MPKLVIHGTLPGLNEYIEAERTNRHLGAKMKRQSQQVVILAARKCLRGFHPQGAVVMDYFSDTFVVDPKNPRVEVTIREVEPSETQK